jgi:hypothetical protein
MQEGTQAVQCHSHDVQVIKPKYELRLLDKGLLLFPYLAVVLSISLLGCVPNQANTTRQRQQLLKEQDRLYDSYLAADATHARGLLEQKIRLLEGDTTLVRAGWAHDLYLDFARLYVLESKTGNPDAADADLIKARYWLLRGCELEGMPTKQVIEEVRRVNGEHLTEMVTHQDGLATGGTGPSYLRGIDAKKP